MVLILFINDIKFLSLLILLNHVVFFFIVKFFKICFSFTTTFFHNFFLCFLPHFLLHHVFPVHPRDFNIFIKLLCRTFFRNSICLFISFYAYVGWYLYDHRLSLSIPLCFNLINKLPSLNRVEIVICRN